MVSKEQIESVLTSNIEAFKLEVITEKNEIMSFNLVHDIIISYKIVEKKDIILNITNLLETVIDFGYAIPYNTSIESIPNLVTKTFHLRFTKDSIMCYFKKNYITNLLLLCYPLYTGDYFLGKIENEINLTDSHYKYNFIIQPCENYEIVKVYGIGDWLYFINPETLNLLSGETTLLYKFKFASYPKSIKLNPDSPSELQCEDYESIKKCVVPVSHFEDKENGTYYTYYLNHFNSYSILYEANPINITIPKIYKLRIKEEDNKN